ncbi:MAG: flagellar filament capping protein FliD [Lachnospiraceae bacterium]|nr:flagellar filament capping protein FliD [Lachnospiraceae bacterium]
MQVSSTSSTTSSSLGDTSISGFGGLVSGLDRDSLIKQMVSGTQSKIDKQNQAMTKEEWTRDALRSITDSVIDLEDNYLMYSSSSSIKSSSLYARSSITTTGNSDSAELVKASGTSSMVDNIRILGVSQLATNATTISGSKGTSEAVKTSALLDASGNFTKTTVSTLRGKTLTFGKYNGSSSKFAESGSITFPTSYTDSQGKTVTIDYTQSDKSELVRELNEAFSQSSGMSLKENGKIQFKLSDDGKISIDTDAFKTSDNDYQIKADTEVLEALGMSSDQALTDDQKTKGISLTDFNSILKNSAKTFAEASVKETSILDEMEGKALTITYGGDSSRVTLPSTQEWTAKLAAGVTADKASDVQKLTALAQALQDKVDKAFGQGKVTVSFDSASKSLAFTSADSASTITLNVEDAELRKNIGLTENASNHLSLNTSIYANLNRLGFDATKIQSKEDLNSVLKDFSINGTKIEGIDSDTTINELLSKINSSEAGVRATYMQQSNQFVLVSKESGSGRSIQLGNGADTIFGGNGAIEKDGQNAKLVYDYGNGVSQNLSSSSNKFNIDGLTVSVSGTFGYKLNADGTQTDQLDSSKAVSFSAKANADTAVDRVKKFIEAYNKIVETTQKELTTRPESGYDPLTDDQKDKMTEKQVEKWEEKAKTGLLYNNTTLSGFNDSLQTVFTKAMNSGISYQDMQKIGISMSDDYSDGGKIVFDETKFRSALESDPDLVSKVMSGDGTKEGLVSVIEDTLTPYATRYSSRNGNSYGTLVEEAGSSRLSRSLVNNSSYTRIKQMQSAISSLKDQLSTEKDRYKSQFDTLETLISNMNAQSAYISGLSS